VQGKPAQRPPRSRAELPEVVGTSHRKLVRQPRHSRGGHLEDATSTQGTGSAARHGRAVGGHGLGAQEGRWRAVGSERRGPRRGRRACPERMVLVPGAVLVGAESDDFDKINLNSELKHEITYSRKDFTK
jgi:hypothetical protein